MSSGVPNKSVEWLLRLREYKCERIYNGNRYSINIMRKVNARRKYREIF